MKAEKKPCPCGCGKFMVSPVIGCQCGTVSSAEADDLVRRWDAFEPPDPGPMTIPTYHKSNRANADALRGVARWIAHDKAFIESHNLTFDQDGTSLTVTIRLEGERLIR